MNLSWLKKDTLKIMMVVICATLAGIQVFSKHAGDQKDLQENYTKTTAEIVSVVGKTGTGTRTRTLLKVSYYHDNKKYTGHVRRAYKKEGYYNKGNPVEIYISKNNASEIK